MNWHQFLLSQRKQILNQIDWLASGRMRVHLNQEDVSEATLAEEKANLAEIEEILTASGVSLD